MNSTRITYPQGDTNGSGRIVMLQPLGEAEETAVVTDSSCFHPLDHTWPDQPADVGQLAGRDVIDCLTGAIGPDGQLVLGAEIPVRRSDPDWSWVVVHVISDPKDLAIGDQVELVVDEQYRGGLSAAHTACHLAALALNQLAASLWRKAPGRVDSLGNPDLDGLAIQSSRISPLQSIDEYRLGKSIRKKGLNTQSLVEELPELAIRATELVHTWIDTKASVEVTSEGEPVLGARSRWRCELPGGVAEYPCGGTHVASFSDLPGPVTITYDRTTEGFESLVKIGQIASA